MPAFAHLSHSPPGRRAGDRPRRWSGRPRAGFSLLEILVASGLMAVLVGLVLTVTFTAVEAWNRATASLTAVQQARSAVDLIQQDLETAVFRGEATDAWMVYEELAVPGSAAAAASGYLRFLARPVDREAGEVGTLSGLAYQVVLANPLRPVASDGRLPALYRGRLTTRNLLAEGALETFGTAAPAAFGLPGTPQFVAAGVAGLTVRFGVSVQTPDGERHGYVLQASDSGAAVAGERVRVLPQISFPLDNFVAEELPDPVRIVAPDWVEVTLLVLPDEALRILEAAEAGLTAGPETEWGRLVERFGTRFVRRVPIPARGW